MPSVRILTVGKKLESWVEESVKEYEKRLQSKLPIERLLLKDDAQLLKLIGKTQVIVLDPEGSTYTSEAFAGFVEKELEAQGAHITFVIGGAEGLPPVLKESKLKISLSSMTFPHQIALVLLIEQLYRATEIWKGSGYNK